MTQDPISSESAITDKLNVASLHTRMLSSIKLARIFIVKDSEDARIEDTNETVEFDRMRLIAAVALDVLEVCTRALFIENMTKKGHPGEQELVASGQAKGNQCTRSKLIHWLLDVFVHMTTECEPSALPLRKDILP